MLVLLKLVTVRSQKKKPLSFLTQTKLICVCFPPTCGNNKKKACPTLKLSVQKFFFFFKVWCFILLSRCGKC